jgi:hypothetical protein
MHDVVDPYDPEKRADALELSLRRLEVDKARERYLSSVAAAEEIMSLQETKDPALAEKQARLLKRLKQVVR